MINPQTDIVQLMINDIDAVISSLSNFLVENGVRTQDQKLVEIVESVKKLKTMKKGNIYYGLMLDENGYIMNGFKIDDFVLKSVLPIDYKMGYYKYIDEKIVLDEERQRQIDEV